MLVKIFSCILNLYTCKSFIIILTQNFCTCHFNYNIILIIYYIIYDIYITYYVTIETNYEDIHSTTIICPIKNSSWNY